MGIDIKSMTKGITVPPCSCGSAKTKIHYSGSSLFRPNLRFYVKCADCKKCGSQHTTPHEAIMHWTMDSFPAKALGMGQAQQPKSTGLNPAMLLMMGAFSKQA